MEKLILIGKISTAHGVKGLVKIVPYCEDINLLNGKIYTSETGENTLEISLKNSLGKYILAQIKGINTREEAENLKTSLYIPRDVLPEISVEDEFYISDLIGLEAISPQGESIGTIIAVDNFGAGDLLEIRPPSGKTFYVPFQNEYVGAVDLNAKHVTILDAESFMLD